MENRRWSKAIEEINKLVDVPKALGTTDALEIGNRVLKNA